jgi:hypothetical protein
MRIAYFVTSYRSPDMLLRLLRTLRRADPGCVLVVHHDRFGSDLDEAVLDGLDVHLHTSDHPVVWGDMTLEAVRWRVLGWMLDHVEFDWTVLLSEQDYPLQPLPVLHERLASCGADAVLEADRLDDVPHLGRRREYQRRYLYRYTDLPRWAWVDQVPPAVRRRVAPARVLALRVLNRVQDVGRVYWFPEALELRTKVGLRPRRSPVGPDEPVWVGSSWYALSRTAVHSLCGRVRERPDLVRHFDATVIPVEAATQTLVGNDPRLVVENAPLHHIRWSRPASGRPDVFGLDDLHELLASGLPFARKFDADDAAVLDALDAHVLGTPVPAAQQVLR